MSDTALEPVFTFTLEPGEVIESSFSSEWNGRKAGFYPAVIFCVTTVWIGWYMVCRSHLAIVCLWISAALLVLHYLCTRQAIFVVVTSKRIVLCRDTGEMICSCDLVSIDEIIRNGADELSLIINPDLSNRRFNYWSDLSHFYGEEELRLGCVEGSDELQFLLERQCQSPDAIVQRARGWVCSTQQDVDL